MIRLTVGAVLAVALLGCEPVENELFVGAVTNAPPTLTAAVRNPFEGTPSINLSAGVGLGLGCNERCPGRSFETPECAGVTYSIEPPELGQIHPVSSLGEGTVLLIGGEPGRGVLTVQTRCVPEKVYELNVL